MANIAELSFKIVVERRPLASSRMPHEVEGHRATIVGVREDPVSELFCVNDDAR